MANFFNYSQKAQSQNSLLSDFKSKEKKKFRHHHEDSLMPNPMSSSSNPSIVVIRPQENYSPKMEGFSKKNNQKTLTWRSPLIFSPNKKFSPQNVSYNVQTQVRNKEDQLFDDSMESIMSKGNNDLTLTYQKSPKKTIMGQNPLSNKRSSQILLSDRDNGREPDSLRDTDNVNIEYRYTGKRKDQTDDYKQKPLNAMEYYSQLRTRDSIYDEKRVINRSENNKENIIDNQNITQFKLTQENQIYKPTKTQNVSNSQMTIPNEEPSPYIQNYKSCEDIQCYDHEDPRELNIPNYCNFNMQFSDGGNRGYCHSNSSLKQRSDSEILSKQFPFAPSNISMSPRIDRCSLNSHGIPMYPNTMLSTICCGRDCENSMTYKPVSLCSLNMSSRNPNLPISQHDNSMPNIPQQYHNSVGYHSQKDTITPYHQTANQFSTPSRSKSQIQNPLVRRMSSQDHFKTENTRNDFLSDENESNLANPNQNRRSRKVNSDESENSPLNRFDTNIYSQTVSPLRRQAPQKDMVVPTESLSYDGRYPLNTMKRCNCQKCIMRQNLTNTYGMNIMIPPYSDYYRNQHSPYFSVPNSTYNPHLINNPYIHYHSNGNYQHGNHPQGNPGPEMIPPVWYCPAQYNDKEYVMQKFLHSLE